MIDRERRSALDARKRLIRSDLLSSVVCKDQSPSRAKVITARHRQPLSVRRKRLPKRRDDGEALRIGEVLKGREFVDAAGRSVHDENVRTDLVWPQWIIRREREPLTITRNGRKQRP